MSAPASVALLRKSFELIEEIAMASDWAMASQILVVGLMSLIGCDLAATNRILLSDATMLPMFAGRSPWLDPVAQLAPHVGSHPLIQHYARVRDDQARRTTDVSTRREWHESAAYRHVFADAGLRYQLAFGRLLSGTTVEGITLSRSTSDFSERERELLSVIGPRALAARTQFATRRRDGGPKFTARERDICAQLVDGIPSFRMAGNLGISPRTVDKHLEHIYRKLGVQTLAEAVAAIVRMRYADGTQRAQLADAHRLSLVGGEPPR